MKILNKLFNTWKHIDSEKINPSIMNIANKKIRRLNKRKDAVFIINGKTYLYKIVLSDSRLVDGDGHRVYVCSSNFYRKKRI
jgi:hypothetical protein